MLPSGDAGRWSSLTGLDTNMVEVAAISLGKLNWALAEPLTLEISQFDPYRVVFALVLGDLRFHVIHSLRIPLSSGDQVVISGRERVEFVHQRMDFGLKFGDSLIGLLISVEKCRQLLDLRLPHQRRRRLLRLSSPPRAAALRLQDYHSDPAIG
jgi:hypothetical protein